MRPRNDQGRTSNSGMNTPIPLTTPVNKGIVTALDQVIDDFFGLSPINLSYANRSAYGKLCREKPQLDGAELVRRLLSRISENRSALTQAGTPVQEARCGASKEPEAGPRQRQS